MSAGLNALAWLKVIGVIVLLVLLGVLGWRIYGLLSGFYQRAKAGADTAAQWVTGGAQDHNVISRVADSVLVPKNEVGHTLGTWLADVFQSDDYAEQIANEKAEENRLEAERTSGIGGTSEDLRWQSPFSVGA